MRRCKYPKWCFSFKETGQCLDLQALKYSTARHPNFRKDTNLAGSLDFLGELDPQIPSKKASLMITLRASGTQSSIFRDRYARVHSTGRLAGYDRPNRIRKSPAETGKYPPDGPNPAAQWVPGHRRGRGGDKCYLLQNSTTSDRVSS